MPVDLNDFSEQERACGAVDDVSLERAIDRVRRAAANLEASESEDTRAEYRAAAKAVGGLHAARSNLRQAAFDSGGTLAAIRTMEKLPNSPCRCCR